jgi:hypothetical protein
MTDQPDNLVLEHLRAIRGDLEAIKKTLADHSRQFIRVREDINNLRSDDLRRETLQAQMDTRLERIETRLNLHDAE